MDSVVVTGATSMLGIATIQECIKNGVHVLALSRAGSRRRNNLPVSDLLRFIECDLSDLDELELPEKDQYDVFYHFGWGYTDRSTRDDPVLQEKNIGYTLAAIELAHRLGCGKFIGAGSQAEYGYRNEPTPEDCPVNPDSCYGYCKFAAGRLAEKLCAAYDMVCVWTRTFSVYGANDSLNTMIPYALRQYRNGEKAYFSSGLQRWDFLHVKDAAVYFYLLGKTELKESVIVNIGAGDTRLLKDYIHTMAHVIDKEGKNGVFSYELADVGNAVKGGIYPDVSRLRNITGYIPQISFEEGISMILTVCGGVKACSNKTRRRKAGLLYIVCRRGDAA